MKLFSDLYISSANTHGSRQHSVSFQVYLVSSRYAGYIPHTIAMKTEESFRTPNHFRARKYTMTGAKLISTPFISIITRYWSIGSSTNQNTGM